MLVGIFSAHDPDDQEGSLTYAIAPGGDPSGKFIIDHSHPSFPSLRLKSDGFLDYADSGPDHEYKVIVRVSDPQGGFLDQTFTVKVNQAPQNLSFADGTTTATVSENVKGAAIATLASTDTDDAASDHYYFLVGDPLNPDDPSRLFEIDGNVLKLKDGISLDYETTGPDHAYSLTVLVRDAWGGSKQQTFTVKVSDKDGDDSNHAPGQVIMSGDHTISEHAGRETVIGTLTSSDPDADDSLTYEIVPGSSNAYLEIKTEIVDGRKIWKLVSIGSFPVSADTAVEVQIRATDNHGASTVSTIPITIKNENRNPSEFGFTEWTWTKTATVEENKAGVTLGTLYGFDPDVWEDTLTYEIAPGGDPSGKFEIVNGALKLKDGQSLDYEALGADHAVRLTLRALDDKGGHVDKVFTIAVKDVAESNTHWAWSNAGRKVLFGSAEADIFAFNRKPGSTPKKIIGFELGKDKIALDDAVFKKIGTGNVNHPNDLKQAFFSFGKPKTKDQHVFYDPGSGSVFYDPDGSKPTKAIEIVRLDKNLKGLSAQDFLII